MTIVHQITQSTGTRYYFVDTATGKKQEWHKPNNLHDAKKIEQALYAAAEGFTATANLEPAPVHLTPVPTASTTLQDYLLGFWCPREAPKIAPSTRYGHESYVRLRIGPSKLGATPLGEITALQCSAFFDFLSASGLSIATIRKYWGFLNKAFSFAARQNIIHENPLLRVDKPVRRADEKITSIERLELPNFLRLQDALKKEPLHWRCLIGLLCVTGLRISEATGLYWSDVSFKDRSISIRRSLCYTPKNGEPGTICERPPKANGYRTVYVSDEVMCDLLAMYCTRNPDSKYIWHQAKNPNKPIFPSSPNHYLARLGKKLGFKLYPHILRHSFASTAICEAGCPVASVSKVLGHQRISTTLDFYTVASQADCQEVSRKVSEIRRAAVQSAATPSA